MRLIHSSLTLRSYDGAADLYVRRFDPVRQDDGRTLVAIHGAGEHGGRYFPFIRRVISSGWTVVIGDLRGHGRSGGLPTHLDHFDQYLADLDLIWDHYGLQSESTAVFAHSMGGLIAARYAQSRPDRMSALILSAPLLGLRVRVQLYKQAVGKLCSVVRPTTRFGTVVKMSQITRNDEALEARQLDPYIHRTVTAGWFFRVRQAIAAAHAQADRFRVPVLLLEGEADEIVNSATTSEWLQKIRSPHVTHRRLPGNRHELISEPGWERTTSDMLAWLNARLAPSPPCPAVESHAADRSIAKPGLLFPIEPVAAQRELPPPESRMA